MTSHALDLEGACRVIKSMEVRGAEAIGLLAADALAVHLEQTSGSLEDVRVAAGIGARRLLETRPTAVTIRHGVRSVMAAVGAAPNAEAARAAAAAAAHQYREDVVQAQRDVVEHGAALLGTARTVLTHCHSSTVGHILVEAARRGAELRVFATETRPFQQGFITANALAEADIPVTLVVDSAAHRVLRDEGIDRVLVGADTIASDGSVYNKIGTAGVAALARLHKVPFYCASSRFKFTDQDPAAIPIEQRPAREIDPLQRLRAGVRVDNPVFDRTPAEYVSRIITEYGLLRPAEAARRCLGHLPAIEAPA